MNDLPDVVSPATPSGADFEEMAVTLLTLAKRILVLFGMALADAPLFHSAPKPAVPRMAPA